MNESNICTFCKCEPESLMHLFVECHYVRAFWTEIKKWILDNSDESRNDMLNTDFILLGNKNASLFLNHILLICKHFIYYSKVINQIPLSKLAIQRVYTTRNIEERICKRNNQNEKI